MYIQKWILLILLLPIIAFGQGDKTVRATGIGASPTQAKNDALRNAVEQGAGIKISSETVVQNFVAVKDSIISESFGLVTSYTVLSEVKKGELYEVQVQAVISKDAKNSWAKMRIILEQQGNPTIMFCIRETLDGVDTPISTGENRLTDVFQNQLKFQVIDRQSKENLKDLQKHLKNLEGDTNAVIAAAADQGANLAVIGMLEGRFKGFQDFYGIQHIEHNYTYTTKIIRTDTAQVIAAFTQTYYKRHNSMGFSREAAGRSGFAEIVSAKYIQPLIEKLVYTWIYEFQNTGKPITVTISNAPFRLRGEVGAALKNASENILSVDVQGYRNKRLTLRVMSKINAEDLAGSLESINGIPLEITEVTRNTIEAKYAGN